MPSGHPPSRIGIGSPEPPLKSVLPVLPAGLEPELDLEAEQRTPAHVLLEQEPDAPEHLLFLKSEALMEMRSPSAPLGESAFGTPGSADVLLYVCQVCPTLSEDDLAELKSSVGEVLAHLRPGYCCFVFCDSFCRNAAPDDNQVAYSRLRMKAALYADLMVYLGKGCKELEVVDIAEEEKEDKYEDEKDEEVEEAGEAEETKAAEDAEETKAAEDAEDAQVQDFSVPIAQPEHAIPKLDGKEEVFGPTAFVPPVERARVCLERFVSMAKVAMVGVDTPIEQMLISSSPALRECIGKGAKSLCQALVHPELGSTCNGNERNDIHSALNFYRGVIEVVAPAARTATDGLVASFFEHLASNWHQEAQVQRRRFQHFTKVCVQYALNWLTLSPARVEAIKGGCRNDPWPVLIVSGLPVVIALSVFALPYGRPDAGHPTGGFLHNTFFVFYGWPLTQATCWYIFPEWARMSAFPELSVCAACVWTLGVTTVVSLAISMLSICTGVFPIPFLTVVNMIGVMPFLPLIWYCIPREVRQRSDSRHRVRWSLIGLSLLIVIFGMFFPLFNGAFQNMEGTYQNVFVITFVSARLAFERIIRMLAKKLDPDMFPVTVAFTVYAYEFSMCVMMSRIKHVLVLAILIGADLCENTFHIWCLWKKRDERDAEGSRLCIVSVVLLREFVELVVPMQLIVMILVFQFGPAKQFNGLVSGFADGMSVELQQTLLYLVIDVVAELIVFMIACTLLRAQGLRPLRLLRGVLEANLGSYVATASACVMFYLQLQHSHFGCDFSFAFPWASGGAPASWSHGLSWST